MRSVSFAEKKMPWNRRASSKREKKAITSKSYGFFPSPIFRIFLVLIATLPFTKIHFPPFQNKAEVGWREKLKSNFLTPQETGIKFRRKVFFSVPLLRFTLKSCEFGSFFVSLAFLLPSTLMWGGKVFHFLFTRSEKSRELYVHTRERLSENWTRFSLARNATFVSHLKRKCFFGTFFVVLGEQMFIIYLAFAEITGDFHWFSVCCEGGGCLI